MAIGMSLNVKKSACIRVGARFNIDCCRIVTKQGCELSWVESYIRYLGIHLVSASSFKCSLLPNAHSIALYAMGKSVELPPVRLLLS